jgi:hypothetical protein
MADLQGVVSYAVRRNAVIVSPYGIAHVYCFIFQGVIQNDPES